MNVLFISADSPKEYNSSRWRVDMPMAAINSLPDHAARKGWIVDWVETTKTDLDCEWADLIVLQRNIVAGALHTTAKWQARGKPVFVDLDDGYEFMPQSLISAQFWINGQSNKDGKLINLGFSPLQHLTIGLKLANGVTSPSPVIVADRFALNSHSVLVPNYPDTQLYTDAAIDKTAADYEPSGRVIIGWGGGGSHLQSFFESGIITALGRVMEARPQVDLLIMGPTELGERFRAEYRKFTSRMTFEGWGDYALWPSRLSRLDIGVAPLVGQYDRRRSWLKGIEYSLMGIPWLGTDYGGSDQPYGDFGPHHLVQNRTKYWVDRLIGLVDNLPAEREAMKGEQAWAKTQDLYINAPAIIAAYERGLNG